ncbi:hypothetical protein ACFWXO_31025 [Kitasatospora sp. NPDC059088]|uniref:GP88 family protein n=1 Tax=Kitasatospora sp. NPDC059088 TaxID=3346722 RepID=UPI0036BE1894
MITRLCYARDPQSSYLRFPGVTRAHVLNLQMVEETPREWEQWMIAELRKPKFVGAVVRIHDAGDFHSDAYTAAWMRICRSAPRTSFYAYTKAIDRMRRIVDPDKPANFEYTPSLGGKEDHLIDLTRQRHADVFPTTEALEAAGYRDQAEDDRLAVDPDTVRVGMAANRIPRLLKRQGDRSFGQLQRDRMARRTALRAASNST